MHKFGAFGDPNTMGVWIYGRRPDGRTVACKNRRLDDGGIRIWSTYSLNGAAFDAVTEFSEDEWRAIFFSGELDQQRIANEILDARRKKPD
ncbi:MULTISPECIES: hypothetical protein [unclassified Brevundimonas]|uniref:hypothetical protein n=1 Tax=unclassified Brevundimonas TaxID=2622653 RepID=UPI0025C13C41|nr:MULTISPECIES: hypothetical protein [unclassified Brevundimonas]